MIKKLSDIKKEAGFEVPKGYFEDVAREAQTRASELFIEESCGRKHGFSVPKNYFREKKAALQNMAQTKKKFIRISTAVLSAAAAIVLALVLWQNQNKTSSDKLILAEFKPKTVEVKQSISLGKEMENIVINQYLANMNDNVIAETITEETSREDIIPESTENEGALTEYLTDYLTYSDIAEEF